MPIDRFVFKEQPPEQNYRPGLNVYKSFYMEQDQKH